jgi:intein/homing endonuclease
VKRDIILPSENSEELAESVGIMFGDGCMNSYSNHTHLIEIAGNSITDRDYHLMRIRNLFKNLFNVTPFFGKGSGEHAIRSIIRSKKIVDFLESKGVHKGKKDILIVPTWIRQNDSFFKAFIRGLFDTDGSVVLRSRGQHSISLTLKNNELIECVKFFLERKGYFVAYNICERHDKRGFYSKAFCIRINQKTLIRRFYEEIGSSNASKITKLEKII